MRSVYRPPPRGPQVRPVPARLPENRRLPPVYRLDLEGGAEERITYHDGFDGLPVFSPDGLRLMWTSSGRTADRKSQLFIADFTLRPATEGAGASAAR